jgi:hypothetical protein
MPITKRAAVAATQARPDVVRISPSSLSVEEDKISFHYESTGGLWWKVVIDRNGSTAERMAAVWRRS